MLSSNSFRLNLATSSWFIVCEPISWPCFNKESTSFQLRNSTGGISIRVLQNSAAFSIESMPIEFGLTKKQALAPYLFKISAAFILLLSPSSELNEMYGLSILPDKTFSIASECDKKVCCLESNFNSKSKFTISSSKM